MVNQTLEGTKLRYGLKFLLSCSKKIGKIHSRHLMAFLRIWKLEKSDSLSCCKVIPAALDSGGYIETFGGTCENAKHRISIHRLCVGSE